jgi:hypothetical protein
MKYFSIVFSLLLVVSCTLDKQNLSLSSKDSENTIAKKSLESKASQVVVEDKSKESYKDTTVHSNINYVEEDLIAKKVVVGSKYYAESAKCKILQRYKVKTNSDFTSSLNLLKYRAAMMGAQRIVIVHHSEINSYENENVSKNEKITKNPLPDEQYFYTTLIADLYDCTYYSENTKK